MREVTLLARLPGGDPAEVFETLVRFDRYAELVETVRSIEIQRVTPTEMDSRWSVFFRKGILHWGERDYLDRGALTITFEQTDGDFDVMDGSWQILPTADGCDITFRTTFDFGVTSIESIVEPIAARVLRENIELILIGLLGEGISFPDTGEQPAEAPRPRYAVFDHDGTPDIPGLGSTAPGLAGNGDLAGNNNLAGNNRGPAVS
jgi:ribosome-associated toxin RatA of RatAB toxin-antitoxin module